MDFTLSERETYFRDRVKTFIDTEIRPRQAEHDEQHHEGERWKVIPVIEEVKAKAKAAGLWNFFMPPHSGQTHVDDSFVFEGTQLTNLEYALCAEEMGKVGWASECFNCSAPDTGNMEVFHRYGTREQKERWLKPLITGEQKACFGVTEPDAGLDTTSLKTFATRTNSGYRVSGRKMWTSTGQVAHKILLLTRTTAKKDCKRPTDGMTLFYTDLDRTKIEVRRIRKMGRNAVDSNAVFIDDLFIPDEDRIGEEGSGFKYILDSLNPERILVASEAIGVGRDALRRATQYAKDRVVFGRPIGQNQGIQHPLAENWAYLESAYWMVLRAAWMYDNGQSCGAEANAAKFRAGRAAFDAATQAVLTHGGMGYAREYQVERLFREAILTRIAPVTEQLILSFLAERVLGLPKSY